MYFNILPKIIGGIGWLLAKVTRQPKFESFFGIEMMFLGNTEALAVSSEQLKRMNEMRVLTIAMMSMSSVSGAIGRCVCTNGTRRTGTNGNSTKYR